jgi:outer membrane protein assembly factor BamB
MLLCTGITLSASNNLNADKNIRIVNKHTASLYTFNCPTADGGMYTIYNPKQVGDSVLILRFDASGNKAWSKTLLSLNSIIMYSACADNGLAFTSQNNLGDCFIKLNADGTIAYTLQANTNTSLCRLSSEANGDINFVQSSHTSNIIIQHVNSSGVADSTLTITNTLNQIFNSTPKISAIENDLLITGSIPYSAVVMRTTLKGNVVWAKTYQLAGTNLIPSTHAIANDGNIIVAGTETGSSAGFVAKINASTGELIWKKKYSGLLGSYTTTISNENYDVNFANFDNAVVYPDGSIMLTALCTYYDINTKHRNVLVHLTGGGEIIQAYYIRQNIRSILSSNLTPG